MDDNSKKILLENKGKMYYSISEVAHEFDVNAHTLRYWENEFNILSPIRNKNRRTYTSKDIADIRVIYNLLKVKKMTVRGAKELLSTGVSDKLDKESFLVERLDIMKAKIEQLLTTIDNSTE